MGFFPIKTSGGGLTGLESPAAAGSNGDLPLVLLHGIQGTARSWQDVMRCLPVEVMALAPNLRGRAGSPLPPSAAAYTLDAFAGDLEAVLAAVGRPVLLAGWSMGVLVILAYIRRYGTGRIGALALLGGTACPDGEANWFKAETAEAIAAEAAQRARDLCLSESAAPVAAAGAWLAARVADYRGDLGDIDVPTLVIHGSGDDQCPLSHGRALALAIPSARLVICEGGGHNLPADSSLVVAEQLSALRADLLPA